MVLCDETHASEAERQVSGLCPEVSQNDKIKESHNLFSVFNDCENLKKNPTKLKGDSQRTKAGNCPRGLLQKEIHFGLEAKEHWLSGSFRLFH